MTKTALEVCTEALRHIKVCPVYQEPEADDYARAKDHLDAIFLYLNDDEELALDWTVATVPDNVWLGLSVMLGGSLSHSYGRHEYAGEWNRGKSMVRESEASPSIDGRPIAAQYY